MGSSGPALSQTWGEVVRERTGGQVCVPACYIYIELFSQDTASSPPSSELLLSPWDRLSELDDVAAVYWSGPLSAAPASDSVLLYWQLQSVWKCWRTGSLGSGRSNITRSATVTLGTPTQLTFMMVFFSSTERCFPVFSSLEMSSCNWIIHENIMQQKSQECLHQDYKPFAVLFASGAILVFSSGAPSSSLQLLLIFFGDDASAVWRDGGGVVNQQSSWWGKLWWLLFDEKIQV